MGGNQSEVGGKRPYTATAQTEIKAQSRQHILEATVALYDEAWLDQITLQQVAQRASVTAKTILRHFGSKENLLAAANEAARARPDMQRAEPQPGSAAAAVACVVAHYEVMGRALWRSLVQEERYPALQPVLADGRLFHETWVRRAFAFQLAQSTRPEWLLNQLYTLTDFFTWKLLRLERDLSQPETEAVMLEMITAVLKTNR